MWSKQIGSIGLDEAVAVGIDRSANCDGTGGTNCIAVTGNFRYTTDFDTGPGTANLTALGAGDVFLAKYSSSGAYLWAKRFGGSNASYPDYAAGLAVDNSSNCGGSGGTGCIVIIGTFFESADVDGVTLTGPNGVNSPFAAKFSSSGSRRVGENVREQQ